MKKKGLLSNIIDSFSLISIKKTRVQIWNGFPPTSGHTHPTSGNSDWLKRDPHNGIHVTMEVVWCDSGLFHQHVCPIAQRLFISMCDQGLNGGGGGGYFGVVLVFVTASDL